MVDKEYRDLAYCYLDQLLELLEKNTLYDIELTHPKLLSKLIVKLHCHTLGGKWLKDLEDALTLTTGTVQQIQPLTEKLSVVSDNVVYFEKMCNRVMAAISDLKSRQANLEDRLKTVSANLKRKYPFDD
ncbi:hypothetical protein A2U01_0049552 [Trifolium medium]|uniref:Uncharacterized protein n=1 Tax=Trifolium medium TaxID=97028 RepID=A0A392QWT2_9FABA|nr:hypothetical protein [Trifolium medium]